MVELLKKGDKVVMHSCIEAKEENGKVFTCITDEQKFKDGDMVVFLDNYSGSFLTKYLQKVAI
jgi:phosphotransferase system IIA component